MKRPIITLAAIALAVLSPLSALFAQTPTKLTVNPFGTSTSYTDVQMLGQVSYSQFWVLANRSFAPKKCELFVSDGTDAGTRKLAEVVSDGTCGTISKSRSFTGGKFFFGMERLNALGISEGVELQIVGDGVAIQVAIEPGILSSNPDSFVELGGSVYFAAQNGTTGREVWKSDGTSASTRLYKDIRPGISSSDASELALYNGLIYLSADDGKVGQEPWVINTDLESAYLLKDLATGPLGSRPSNFFEYSGILFFGADVAGRNLYATTGTAATTALFKDILTAKSTNPTSFSTSAPASGNPPRMYFLADTLDAAGNFSYAIWRSDGTAAGTTSLVTVGDRPTFIGTLIGGESFVFQYSSASSSPRCKVFKGSSSTTLWPCYYPTLVNGSLYYYESANFVRYDITAAQPKSVVASNFNFNGSRGSTSSSFVAHEYMYGGDYLVQDRECPLANIKKFPGVCGCNKPDLDTDLDTTYDCQDSCPTDPRKTSPGICGCGSVETDTDKDGTLDCKDACPLDPGKVAAGLCGCGKSDVDTDGDGTPDCLDTCPSDPKKKTLGTCGCGVAETDTDGDGTLDCRDGCTSDSAKIAPGACGCGVVDRDSDGDKKMDCVDGCPNDPTKEVAGSCGCGVPDTDTDSDGDQDCLDPCKTDPTKKTPGVCGCGVPDVDTDRDGILDCKDGCSLDKSKSAPGSCGCGVADVDTDKDGVMDCKDGCIGDSGKASIGQCGCGHADTDSDKDGVADCVDYCPSDPTKNGLGRCGCGKPENDTDGDFLPDCVDGCPANKTKQDPGVCGCEVPDEDQDKDGFKDCIDACPTDPSKRSSGGQCGCGKVDAFSDSDQVADCLDACPLDPSKLQPGVCGCGAIEIDANGDGAADCFQADSVKKVPTKPVISVNKRVATITLPSNVGGKSQINFVSYRLRLKVKGKEKSGRIATVRTKSKFMKIKLPKAAVGIEASYSLTAYGQKSPLSDVVYAEAK